MNILRILTTLLAVVIIAGCVNRSAPNAGSNGGPKPDIVIAQPVNTDSVAPVVDAIHTSLVQVARQTHGADVPQPQIRILRADGKAEVVAPPNVDGVGVALFGENNPKTKQTRMEAQLQALGNAMVSGCKGSTIQEEQLRTAAATLFNGKPFTVWMVTGGIDPWNRRADQGGPTKVIEDCTEFESQLANLSVTGGNVLIIPDNAFDAGSQPASPAPKSAQAAPGVEGINTVSATSASSLLTPDDRPPAADHSSSGDIIIGFNLAGSAAASASALDGGDGYRVESVLPAGVEPVGDPVTFASGSAKVSPADFETINRIATQLVGKYAEYEVLLVASTDPSGLDADNLDLSRERASAIEAVLLRYGVVVHRVISIGASLAQDGTPKRNWSQYRSVRIYVLRREEVVNRWLSNQVGSQSR